MNNWLVRALVGCMLGTLSGLGVGGGSLLMLWLTQIAGTDQAQARLMNLMFFIPCALTATLFRWRQAKPNPGLVLSTVAGGLLGALAGNLLHGLLPPELARKALGGLFLLCGIRELSYRGRKFR